MRGEAVFAFIGKIIDDFYFMAVIYFDFMYHFYDNASVQPLDVLVFQEMSAPGLARCFWKDFRAGVRESAGQGFC